MGLKMPMVQVLAALEHHGVAFSSLALSEQLPLMEQRLQQLREQAKQHIKHGDLEKVLWNNEHGADALNNLLYRPTEQGGLGLVPPVGTAKGK